MASRGAVVDWFKLDLVAVESSRPAFPPADAVPLTQPRRVEFVDEDGEDEDDEDEDESKDD